MSVESNLPWRCENKKEDGDICQNMIKPADKFCCECGVKIVRRMALDSGHVASCTASGVNLQELSVRPAVISLEPAKSQSLPEPPGQSVTILSECDNCKKYDSQVSDSSSSSFMGPYHEGCKSGEEFRSWTMLDGDKEYCEYSGQEGCSFIASYVKETANSAVLESSCGDSSFQSTCLGEADRRSEDNGIQNVEESIVFAENKCDKTVSCDCLNQSLHKKLTIPDKSVLDQKDEGRIELINSMAGKQCDSVEQVDPPNLWIEKTVGNSNHFNLTKSLNVEPVSIRMVEDEDEIVAESHKGEHTLVAHNFSPDQQLNDSSELVGRESSRHIDTPVSLMVGHADAPITPVAMKDERADTCCSPESSLKVVANIADWEDVKRVASNAVQCEDNVVEESEGKRDEPVSSVLRATASTEEYGQSSDFDSGSESTCQTTDSTLHDSSKGVSTGHYACEDKLCSIQTLPPSRAYVGQNMASVTSHLQDHGGSSVLPSKGEHVVKSDDLNVSSSATSVVTPNKMEQSALCGGDASSTALESKKDAKLTVEVSLGLSDDKKGLQRMPSDHGDGLNNGNNRVPPDDMKNQKNAGRVENWPATRSQDDALSAEIKGTGNEQHSTQTRASRKSNRKGAIIDKTQIPGCEGITTAFDDKQSATTEEIPLLQQSTSSGANLTLVSKGDATKPKSDVSVLQKIKDKATDIATGVSNTVSKYKSKRRRKKEQKAKKRRGKNKKTQRNGADNDDDDDEELSLSELSLQDDTTKAVVEQHTSENARKSSKCEAENYSSSKPSAQNEQQLATRQSRDQQETKPGTTGRQKSYAEITRADGKSKGTSTTSENAIVTSEASKATSKDAVQAPGDMADVAQKPDPAKNTPGRTTPDADGKEQRHDDKAVTETPYSQNYRQVTFHVVLSPYFNIQDYDSVHVIFEDRFTGWNNFQWLMTFERFTDEHLIMMSCLVNIPQYLEKRLFYKYVVQKPREMKKLHEMIGSYENGNRVLNVQCLDETQPWHQFDGIAKPNWGFWKQMTETVSGPYSAYEIHSKMAALACFQLLDGLSQDYCQQHKCNSAELILHEFYCAAYCIEHSFLNAGGSPMGRKFLQEVA